MAGSETKNAPAQGFLLLKESTEASKAAGVGVWIITDKM